MAKPLKIRIYLEGGGTGEGSASDIIVLKRSFSTFFKKILRYAPMVIPVGSGDKAISHFVGALPDEEGEISLLLKDSEMPVPIPEQMSFKAFLTAAGQRKKNSRLLARADELQIFLMVQCIEAWFVADREGLAGYYSRSGNQFDTDELLPQGNQSVEDLSCADIQASIDKALAKADAAKPKEQRRKYLKRHAFEIIGYIDPHKVAAASPHAKRLFDELARLQRGR